MVRCVWFSATIFLRQTSNELDDGCRTRMLSLVLWLSATYVLGDVYSAQLTSQLARPATEVPINTLARLERAVVERGYHIYAEKESVALGVLQNGTGVFHKLYGYMLRQPEHLVDSVEDGVLGVVQGTNVVMGGRETLYFNIRKFGPQDFQLSEKLYTRYSAVAVQQGSPYLESLNIALMRLFEAGILEKITSLEYERMFNVHEHAAAEEAAEASGNDAAGGQPAAGESSAPVGDTASGGKEKPKASSSNEHKALQAISLRMLQGAFLVLACGYVVAGLVLLCEIHHCKKKKKEKFFLLKLKKLKLSKEKFQKSLKDNGIKIYKKSVEEFHKLLE